MGQQAQRCRRTTSLCAPQPVSTEARPEGEDEGRGRGAEVKIQRGQTERDGREEGGEGGVFDALVGSVFIRAGCGVLGRPYLW